MIIICIRIAFFASLISIFFLVWRVYLQGQRALEQGGFAIQRMLEMEDARSRMVSDLKVFSEGLADLLKTVQQTAETSTKKQAALADGLVKRVETAGVLLNKKLDGLGDQLSENTELTKQVSAQQAGVDV